MAAPKNNMDKKAPAKNVAGVRSDREKLFRALLVLFILIAAATALVFGVFWARQQLFNRNDRFKLREVVVKSGGYWQDKAPLLSSRLGIRPGMNLFSLKPAEIRRQLMATPSVGNCEVVRILPDTLHLRVIERIPRAVLGNPRARWVVDETGMVIPRLESMSVSLPLPVILGMRLEDIEAGMKLDALNPALELIMLTVRNFPDISIVAINVRNPEKLEFFMRYRNQKSCKVIIPAHNRNFAFLLSTLQSAIIHAERRGDTRGTFDLSFDGNVIIR